MLQEREQQILETQRQIIGFHLQKDFVARHFMTDLAKARYCRAIGDMADKPSFFFISEIFSAVYDKDRQKVYEGKWYSKHSSVSNRAKMPWYYVLSGDIICLRALPQVKIFVFSNALTVNASDLKTLSEAGYLVMDEEYR